MAASEKNPQEIAKAAQLNHVPQGDEYEKMISGMLYVDGFPCPSQCCGGMYLD
jgi:hypothetical protein